MAVMRRNKYEASPALPPCRLAIAAAPAPKLQLATSSLLCLPHRQWLFTSPVRVRQSAPGQGPALHVEWDNGACLVGGDGSYHLAVPELELDVHVVAEKPPMLHGSDGETLLGVGKLASHQIHCHYRGDEISGTAWVDHEYSLEADALREKPKPSSYGWNWFSLLTLGTRAMEICITQVLDARGIVEQYIVYLDEAGRRHRQDDFTLEPSEPWVSGHTFQKFHTHWRLTIPALDVDVEVSSVAHNQEFQTWLRMPSFYEGAVRFKGTWEGAPIKGYGAMELVHALAQPEMFMEKTLSNASVLVRAECEKWVPTSMGPGHLKHVTQTAFDTVEEDMIQKKIVDAFYMLNTRGGKNWRPMLCGAAIGLVNGSGNNWRPFFVIPELIHTASLIIDDIEDESETRRGGPCVHTVLGVPTAINAGCALYFWGETLVRDNKYLTDAQRLEFYSTFFRMMRVGHVGQALEIAGMVMGQLPSIDEAHAMVRRLINVHRCKSGIPASFCGIAGSILGKGTPEQTAAIGAHVENLGIAFQIRDDVLDVLGKVRGKCAADDLHNHKITYPVAKLFTLDHPDRDKWYAHWQAHDVGALVDALKSSGTLELCNDDIQRRLDEGWHRVDALTPNSFSKVLFRMFANYLIKEHY